MLELVPEPVNTQKKYNKLPLKYAPRQAQTDILEFFKKSVKERKKNILIDAPVGIGKSYSVVMMMDWYLQNVDSNAKFDILTNTKILQDQYTKDFPFIFSIKGKSNYSCEHGGGMNCKEGADYNKIFETGCEYCPYTESMKAFMDSTIGLTNFHYYIGSSMYASLAERRGANVLFIDECHAFEEVFCNYVSIRLSKQVLKNLDILTDDLEKDIDSMKSVDDVYQFVENKLSKIIKDKMDQIESDVKFAKARKKKEYLKRFAQLDNTLTKFANFSFDRQNHDRNWVFEETENSHTGDRILLVEPIWGKEYLEQKIWSKYDYIVCLSGTIINKDMFCFMMDFNKKQTSYMALETPFPKENRPIYYIKAGKMSYKEKHKTFITATSIIEEIVDQFKQEKGIIHTGNYEFAFHLMKNSSNIRYLFHESSEDREESYLHHLENKRPTVLVSPSMMNGVDLKDELSRFQIISKIPYPHLGNKKVQQRKEVSPEWYVWRAIVDMVQSYGRSIRSEDDYASTFLIDECFDALMSYNKHMIPKYFLEAIVS